jgi:tellurite resistance protein
MSLERAKIRRRSASDDALLFHAMYVTAAVDGSIAPEERKVLSSVAATVPELRQTDFIDLATASDKIIRKYGGVLESIEAFTEMSSDENLRLKCFALAVEVAYASGSINPAEEQLISTLGKILGLKHALTDPIIQTMGYKYAT